MKIILLEPQGYCHGVKTALAKLEQTINNKDFARPIYLSGEIIHNKFIINHYLDLGVIILPEEQNKKLEALKNVKKGTLVLQAHGSSPELKRLAEANNLKIIDATCSYVNLVHTKIKQHLDLGYEILYVGKKNHAETEAVLAIDKNIKLITNQNDVNNLNINNDKIYVSNQTTLSILDLKDTFDLIKKKFPNALIDNKICNATYKRQTAILEQENVDLTIVIGDKGSSNSVRLAEIASQKNKTLFIESVNDILNYDFTLVNSVSITSGASTPQELVDDVVSFLESLPK